MSSVPHWICPQEFLDEENKKDPAAWGRKRMDERKTVKSLKMLPKILGEHFHPIKIKRVTGPCAHSGDLLLSRSLSWPEALFLGMSSSAGGRFPEGCPDGLSR